MKLHFTTNFKDGFWTVAVHSLEDSFGDGGLFQEPLNEAQYESIAKWCSEIFQTNEQPKRARRMSYDTFWFTSQRDLDWFILHWSSVDSESF